MNRSVKIALMSALCGSLILAVSAGPLPQAQDNPQASPQQAQPRGRLGDRLGAWVGLTPEQQSRLDALRKADEEQCRTSATEMEKLEEELRTLGQDLKSDPAKADGLIDRLSRLQADRMKSTFRFHQDFEKILTPEQRERVARFRSRFAERAGHRHFGGLFRPFRWGFGFGEFLGPRPERRWAGFAGGLAARRGILGLSRWRLDRAWRHIRGISRVF